MMRKLALLVATATVRSTNGEQVVAKMGQAMRRDRIMRLFPSLAILFVAGSAQPQQPFDLDPSFRTTINSWYVSSILPQSDGKVIVSGQIKFADDGPISFRSGARLNSDGTMDPTFAYPAYMGGNLIPWEGKIYQGNGPGIRRSWPDGTLDNDYVINPPYVGVLQGGDYHVYPDGRILMSGVHTLNDSIRDFMGYHCLIWFSNTGYLDTTKTHRKCAGSLDFFRELPNGQFIGSLGNPPNSANWEGQATGSNVIRFNADGEWDPSFQANVWWGTAYGFLPLEDGRVYAAGRFRISTLPNDTLHLVRFMPDGSLDPTFNNFINLGMNEQYSPLGPVAGKLHLLGNDRLILTGGFDLVEGETRRGICLLDTNGVLVDDHFTGPGNGVYDHQGFTYGTIEGITPAHNGSYYIWGAYHGYDDGTTNDTLQRMVSRLHGLNVGFGESNARQHALSIWPNPSETFLHATWHGRQLQRIELHDALGRVVLHEQQAANGGALNVSGLSSGAYTVVAYTKEGEHAVMKWIKP